MFPITSFRTLNVAVNVLNCAGCCGMGQSSFVQLEGDNLNEMISLKAIAVIAHAVVTIPAAIYITLLIIDHFRKK